MRPLGLALALIICAQQSIAEKPQRIASLNLCTDQVLLMLVAKHRVVSVTHLAAQPEYSYTWQQAQGIHQNTGMAEQVIPLQPDLILASPYSPGSAVNLLSDLDFPIQVIDVPLSLGDVETFVRNMGELVQEPQQAELIIQKMQSTISQAQQPGNKSRQPSAIIYAPNGHTAGNNTLKHDVLKQAGFRNLAAELGIEHYGNLSIEQLLYSRPDWVIIDDSTKNQDSLAQRFTTHPALQKALGNSQIIAIDTNQWLCAGPMAAHAIKKLADLHK